MSRRSPDPDPAFDPVAERLTDIGRHLRETRQQRGEDLYDVADYLRIKPAYLFALEEGDLAAMPGRTYAVGFLRTYADHLGFDGAQVARDLNATAREKSGAALKVRAPAPENRLPSLAVVVAALLVGGVAYTGWFAVQSGDTVLARIKAVPGEIGQYAASLFEEDAAAGVADTAAPQPPEMLVAEGAASATRPTATGATAGSGPAVAGAGSTMATGSLGVGSTAPPPSTAGSVRLQSTPPAGLQAREVPTDSVINGDAGATRRDDETLASLVLDAEAERGAALRRLDAERPDGGTVGELLAGLQPDPEMPAAAAGTTAPVISTTGRVVLLARETSWIQVQSPSRDFLRSTTLEPGQRFELPDRTDLALWTGNAGGIEIWVDGRNIGALGQSGSVVRDVSLAPDALIARR